jgi:hypothetical protein
MSIDVLAMPTRTNRKGLFVNVSWNLFEKHGR